jgi:Asp-tRNA(Asn)/Glu-tRNA(Gln) amidotransferase A subunit family amidase
MPYDLQTIPSPRLVGTALSVAARLLESGVTRPLLVPKLMRDTGITRLREASLVEAPSVVPALPRPATLVTRAPGAFDLAAILAKAPVRQGFAFETVADFAAAYRTGKTTPEEVAERVVAAVEAGNARTPSMRAIVAMQAADVRAQALAAGARFRAGRPLGPLDGVPVAVKDELDVRGYPTTAGTSFLKDVAAEDATVVARLRAAGAVILGKANMHEIGIDTSGFNPHLGTARNPYDPGRYTGGSSSGSAAAVAAGLCPIAVGADGGGSIRIPAALCGVFGLKATWSRISEGGAFPLCWSVGHVGPLAATARDCALGYALMAGPDPRDANTLSQPSVDLDGFGDGIEGLRLGVYAPWFEHAAPEVVAACRAMLKQLESKGARIVEVELHDLELARLAHAVTILCEMATSMDRYDAAHRTDFSLGTRINLAIARELTGRDYVRAQQVRTRMSRAFDAELVKADVIVTPTTAITAPPIAKDVLPRGESDLDVTSALMRFVFASNLTGHPAISFPAGYDANGIPVGLQAIGRPWAESTLLRLAAVAEGLLERRAPAVHSPLLG